jgi:riboflavin synthase
MFTGIIKETGIINQIIDMGEDREFKVNAVKLSEDINTGDSISVNGVCLTVKSYDSGSFTCDISSSTLKYTNLGDAKAGDTVNLEDALSPGDKLGGHFVSGHIDGGRSYEMTFSLDSEIAPFIAGRGSVAIDGISLTVTEVEDDSFKTVIIPHTFENTTLGKKRAGETVNIEADMLARYIVNYLSRQEIINTDTSLRNDRILKEKLEKNGFI